MQQSPPNRIAFPPKDFLDDSASTTSSTIASRQKFTRKTDERSATRRPISKGSREKIGEPMDIGRFYRKMGNRAEERPCSPTRKNIINRQQDPERNRKRSPTPVPGYQKKREKSGNSSAELQIELQVCELRKRLASQQQQKQLLVKRVAIFQREIKSKLLKIQQLQALLSASQEREAAAGCRLQQFQLMIAQGENNLTQARSSLQKLKNTIRQNKYALLQADKLKLKQENTSLQLQLQRVNAEVQMMGNQVSFLANQVTLLTRANEHLSNSHRIQQKMREIQALQRVILSSKTQRQRSLQEMVEKVKRQNSGLRVKLQKLQMKLDLVNRKRNRELSAVKQSKNEIIIKLKNKISTIFQLNHTLRAENDELKTKYSVKTATSRKNNLMQECEQCFRLQLSP